VGERAAGSGDKPSEKGSGNSSGNNRSSQQGNHHHAFKKPVVRQPKFEGKCDERKGLIFDCSDSRQADVFVKTTREIPEYVGRSYRYGSDTRLAIENLVLSVLDMPVDPPTDATKIQTRIWEKKVDEYVKRETNLQENRKTLYSLVWGQCTYVIRARLEALETHRNMSDIADSIKLLKAIKALVFDFQSQKYGPQALHKSKRPGYTGSHKTSIWHARYT
jgi:hypothetical protein